MTQATQLRNFIYRITSFHFFMTTLRVSILSLTQSDAQTGGVSQYSLAIAIVAAVRMSILWIILRVLFNSFNQAIEPYRRIFGLAGIVYIFLELIIYLQKIRRATQAMTSRTSLKEQAESLMIKKEATQSKIVLS